MFEFMRKKKDRSELAREVKIEADADKIRKHYGSSPYSGGRLSPITEKIAKGRARYFSVTAPRPEELESLQQAENQSVAKPKRRSTTQYRSPPLDSAHSAGPHPARPGCSRARSSSWSAVSSLHNPFRGDAADSWQSTSQVEIERPINDVIIPPENMRYVVSHAPVLVSPQPESAEVFFRTEDNDDLPVTNSFADNFGAEKDSAMRIASGQSGKGSVDAAPRENAPMKAGLGRADFLHVTIPAGIMSPFAEPASNPWARL